MGYDDRDRSFEKALAQQLRSTAQAGSRDAACPDAETLAAYHERNLSLEDLSSWKTHIAACARCQEILVQLEITDHLPVGTTEEELAKENVLGVSVPRMANTARGVRELQLSAAAPAQSRPSQLSNAPPKSATAPVATLPPRKAYWRWTAPVGAIAAGLLVWVVFHENKSIPVPPPPSVEVAINRDQSPSPSPAQTPARSRALTKSAEPKEKDQLVQPHQATTAGNRRAVAAPSPKQELTTSNKKTNSIAAPIPPAAAPLVEAETSDAASDLNESKRKETTHQPVEGRNVAGLAGHAPAPATRPAAKAAAAGAAATAPPPAPSQSPDMKQKSEAAESATVSGSAPGAPADSTVQLQTTESAAVSSSSVELTKVLPYDASLRMAAIQRAHTIPAPGDRVIWRVGVLGFIQRTDDGGKTWKLQKSGVTLDLVAGSAPSEKVCWVAGRAGILLWTSDAGKHWVKLTSPTNADLAAVHASDDLHASLADANGKTYETNDGGKTWIPLANP